MAGQKDIEGHYDTVGTLHALRLLDEHGGFPDYTCALFDGDRSKSLKQAQLDKHTWIFDGLGLSQDLTGKRILDIGCGWGPILNAVRERGGEAIGLTLSPGQVAHCMSHGLDARLLNYKDIAVGQLGQFDGIVSIGAIEHFCGIDEQLAGHQDDVYRRFFEICASLLKPGGRLYLQTMTWNDDPPDYRKLSLSAPRDSREAILKRLEQLYPNSWPPNGLRQMQDTSAPYFDFISSKNGRKDYLITLEHWDDATKNLLRLDVLPRALKAGVPLLCRALVDKDAWTQLQSIRRGDQYNCFDRGIMSHERMFFSLK